TQEAFSWQMMFFRGRELILAGYFLLALTLLLWAVFGGIRQAVERLEIICFGQLATNEPPLAYRFYLRRYLPFVFFVPLAIPYVLGVSFIHRLKTPNPVPERVMAGRPFVDVVFTTADGYTLRGWFLAAPSGPSDRTLLVCHGIGDNRSNVLGLAAVGDEIRA